MITLFFVWPVFVGLPEGVFFSAVGSSENPTEADDLAKIDSGFFVSKNDVYELRDQVFREKLVSFLTEKAILTKSSRGLIYYYVSEDAIARIEDPEFKKRLVGFVTEPLVRKTYVVQPGDSLWKIATKYGISVEELVRLNHMTETDPVYPGQELVITPGGN